MAKITRTESVTLSEDDVKAAISNWLKFKYGDNPAWNITMGTKTEMHGYGPGEYEKTYVVVSASREIP